MQPAARRKLECRFINLQPMENDPEPDYDSLYYRVGLPALVLLYQLTKGKPVRVHALIRKILGMHLEEELKRHNNSVSSLSRELHVSRSFIYELMKEQWQQPHKRKKDQTGQEPPDE